MGRVQRFAGGREREYVDESGALQDLQEELAFQSQSLQKLNDALALQQLGYALDDHALTTELNKLEQCLYGNGQDQWRGDKLRSIVERLQGEKKTRAYPGAESLGLYPS